VARDGLLTLLALLVLGGGLGFAFHLELQTERRSLVTLTYTELLNEPFEVVPASGAILDTRVTLRYDVPRDRIEEALLEAARVDEIVFDKALKARKIDDFDDLLGEIDERLAVEEEG
jgi:hypothetical protein